MALLATTTVGCVAPEHITETRLFDTLPGQVGVLDSENNRLAIVDNQQLHVLGFSDDESLRAQPLTASNGVSIGHDVSQIILQAGGGYWLHNGQSISRWNMRDGLCTVDQAFTELSVVTNNGSGTLSLVDEFYIDGTGVVGEQFTVDTACQLERGSISQPVLTRALSIDDGSTIEAYGALLKAGPRTLDGPTITYKSNDAIVAQHLVFEEQNDAYQVIDMIATEGRLLALANNGSWELWNTYQHERLLAGSSEGATSLHSLDNNDAFVVAGNNLVDMQLASSFPMAETTRILSIDSTHQRMLSSMDGELHVSDSTSLVNGL